MAEVLPFAGLRYNPDLIKDMGAVVAPPYDVISPAEQQTLYRRHPWNVIRLILNYEYATDAAGRNRYSRAASTLCQWRRNRVLMQDEAPAFYAYWQNYTLPDGKTYLRKGLLARLALSPFGEGIVYPHELTHKKARTDRTQLMEACEANLSPVFLMYPDNKGTIKQLLPVKAPQRPVVDYTDDAGVRHRMWPLPDAGQNAAITKAFNSREVYIADGHHRYTASLAYRDAMRKRLKSQSAMPFDYTMAYLTSMHDDGLCVLPIHRTVFNLPDSKAGALNERLSEYFEMQPLGAPAENLTQVIAASVSALRRSQGTAFVLYDRAKRSFTLLQARRDAVRKALAAQKIAAPLMNVDVIVLHTLVFEHILGISPKAQEEQLNLTYIKGNADLTDALRRGPCQFAFLMNPLPMDTLQSVVQQGHVLPQKSTFFYPKLLSGLVFHSLRVDDDRR